MLRLYNDQISLLTVLAVIIHRPSLYRPPVYNDCRNFVPKWLLYTGLTVVTSNLFLTKIKLHKINILNTFNKTNTLIHYNKN